MSDYNDGILPEPCLRMDTHFGDEYESVEFGDGTGFIKAAPILAKVGALHEEIDRLRDESSFLRECIALNARDANAENERLRELVKDLLNAWDDMQHEVVTGPTFDDCERRAYKLGIEVDA